MSKRAKAVHQTEILLKMGLVEVVRAQAAVMETVRVLVLVRVKAPVSVGVNTV